MQTERPELGTPYVGQRVYVRRSYNDMRNRPDSDLYIPAEITKVGRLFVTIADERGGRESRMRIATQQEDTNYSGSQEKFVTPDQRDYDEALVAARRYLRDQGLRIEPRSTWDGREVELADLIKANAATSD